MKTLFLGERPKELEAFLDRRRALGQDGYDEVWEGVYHVAPMAHRWHGYVDGQLGVVLAPYGRRVGLLWTTAFNLGDPDDFRVPDGGFHRTLPSTVYVPTAAILVEVVSPDDETWEKFGFYAARGVDEICTAEPLERRLRWWRRDGDLFVDADASSLLGVTVAEVTGKIDWPR